MTTTDSADATATRSAETARRNRNRRRAEAIERMRDAALDLAFAVEVGADDLIASKREVFANRRRECDREWK